MSTVEPTLIPADEQLTQTASSPTQPNNRLGQLNSSDGFNGDILPEITFFAGGAGCGMKNIGVSDRVCNIIKNWPIVLQINGIFRVSDQGRQEQYPWWGDKFDSCYETLQFGDMVYFSAQGYPEGEVVIFNIRGPNGSETYTSKVSKNIKYSDQRSCAPYALTSAARLSWVADPKLGNGEYVLTVNGTAGQATLMFRVEQNQTPTFGMSVGDTSLPLVLGPEKKIKLIYSGFNPNEIVTSLIYRVDTSPNAEEFVRYIDVPMDQNGNSSKTIEWDSSLPTGNFWLLTPKVLPEESPVFGFGVTPALWSVYFYAGVTPPYDADKLASATQNIFLRPSCGTKINIQPDKVINLQYGVWGVNGEKLLNSTKDKIITRLYVDGEEIIGYRSNKNIVLSELPCGDRLENSFFLYNEAQIGPFYSWDTKEEIDILVVYSFTDAVTDGYDLSPRDGQDDVYSQNTTFNQTYKLKVNP